MKVFQVRIVIDNDAVAVWQAIWGCAQAIRTLVGRKELPTWEPLLDDRCLPSMHTMRLVEMKDTNE